MKIEAIELRHLSMQLRAPFETSFGVEHERQCVIVRVQAEGLEGWGECVAGQFAGYSYETSETAWSILSAYLVPPLLGAELSGPGDLAELVGRVSGHPMAKAGLELAIWDLTGKRDGEPLAQQLGGQRRSVPVGVSIGIQPDEQRLLDTVGDYLNQGYRRVKLKIKPGHDWQPVRAVRREHPELALQVDANAAYSPDELEPLVGLDEYGLLMIEQPFPKDDLLSHIRLGERVGTPLCLDESIGSAREAQQALELGACRVINIKPGRVGGLREAVAIHDQCAARSAPAWCGGMLETGIGRAANLALASLPGFVLPGDLSASDRYYAEDIALPRFALNPDSTIDVPGGPGLGVEIDRQALDRFTLRRQEFRA